MQHRIERIRQALEEHRPLVAALNEEDRQRRDEVAKLNADVDALELRLAQIEDADDEMLGVLTEAVERAWADIQLDLRKLSSDSDPDGSPATANDEA